MVRRWIEVGGNKETWGRWGGGCRGVAKHWFPCPGAYSWAQGPKVFLIANNNLWRVEFAAMPMFSSSCFCFVYVLSVDVVGGAVSCKGGAHASFQPCQHGLWCVLSFFRPCQISMYAFVCSGYQVFVGETETGRSWRRGKEEPTLGALRSAVQALAPPEAA